MHHDPVDINALTLGDDEPRAGARLVGREVEQRTNFDEGEPLFFEGPLDAMARRLDFGLRDRPPQRKVGLGRQILLDQHAVSFEREIVERRARTELDGRAHPETRFAHDPPLGIGGARERWIERGLFDGEPLGVESTSVDDRFRWGEGEANPGRRMAIALPPHQGGGTDRGREIPLAAVIVLQVLQGAFVDLGNVRGPRHQLERFGASPLG